MKGTKYCNQSSLNKLTNCQYGVICSKRPHHNVVVGAHVFFASKAAFVGVKAKVIPSHKLGVADLNRIITSI